MPGNLIDNQVNKYQQNIQPTYGYQVKPQVVAQGTQTVDTTPQADTFENTKDDGHKKLLIMLATWLGLNKTTDLFNSACTNDKYEKTIVGRLGNLGDRIANKSGKNKHMIALNTQYNAFKTAIKNYINSKPMLSAMFNTPTKPENSFVKGFMETQRAADLSEATKTLNGYIDEMPKTLKEAGATKAEIQALKAKYGTNIFGKIKNVKQAIQELQFNRIGAAPNFIDTLPKDKIAETLKEMKIKHLGLDPDTYKSVLEKPEKHFELIREACKRGGKSAKAFFGRYSLIPGLGFITKRSTNLSMSYNKLSAEVKHSTKLGKALAKSSKLFMRGLTFGGGKLGSLMVAFGLGTALYNATKAPKKQKVGTAVAGGVEAVSWVVSMPLAVTLMHGVNGLANTGLSKMQVAKYRVALREFNKKVDAGLLKNKTAYCRELVKLNRLKKVTAPQGKFTKIMTKIGHILSVGLENPKPFKEATAGLASGAKMSAIGRNIKRMLPYLGKNAAAYPLRFALYMLAFSPLVDKVISSATSAIFGKPYEPEEEENKDEKVANQPQQQVPAQNIPQQQTQTTPTKNVKSWDIDSLPDENLIKQAVQGKQVMEAPRYIPDEKCAIEGITSPYDTVEREYIPSETAAPVIQSNINDKNIVDAAIQKADKAEAKALDALNGIY